MANISICAAPYCSDTHPRPACPSSQSETPWYLNLSAYLLQAAPSPDTGPMPPRASTRLSLCAFCLPAHLSAYLPIYLDVVARFHHLPSTVLWYGFENQNPRLLDQRHRGEHINSIE